MVDLSAGTNIIMGGQGEMDHHRQGQIQDFF